MSIGDTIETYTAVAARYARDEPELYALVRAMIKLDRRAKWWRREQ